jgi:predicted nucleic acid-binding Zn ribbon protein
LSACSSRCQEVLGYLPRTQLRARGISHEFF